MSWGKSEWSQDAVQIPRFQAVFSLGVSSPPGAVSPPLSRPAPPCQVVFRYALAIFKYNEKQILRLQDGLEIYQYLRLFTKTICDGRKLTSIAFNDMNPFPMRQLQQQRAAHRERLEAELRELERLKAEFLERQASCARAAPEACAIDDDADGEA